MNATDPFNAMLNYGYAILESHCRKTLNSVGLEPTIGFLHETRQTKHALVYDLMEPYRWLVDTAITSCIENGIFSSTDFYRMDNYVLRLKAEATHKLLNSVRIKFNSTILYRNKLYGWDTVMRLKCQELAKYILNRQSELDFESPSPLLPKDDSQGVKNRILSMSITDAERLGIRKNTLWYLQKRSRTRKPLKTYSTITNKILNY
jgi:CRISPR-associated protein Cas1